MGAGGFAMKRLIIICVLLLSLTACATDGTTPPIIHDEAAQNALIIITARNIAFFVGRNNPDIIESGILVCSVFDGAEPVEFEPLIVQWIKYLDVEIEDYPMAKADLETLLSIFNIQVLNADIPLTDRQIAMVKIAAAAMIQGFEFAKENPKKEVN